MQGDATTLYTPTEIVTKSHSDELFEKLFLKITVFLDHLEHMIQQGSVTIPSGEKANQGASINNKVMRQTRPCYGTRYIRNP